MLNNVTLLGRLTRDPELRHTQSNIPVASFTLAVERDFKEGGQKQTDFVDCIAWRGTAEFVSKYFVKGQMAAVTGRLQIRDWTDKEGNKRRNAEVVADQIYFTGSKRESGGDTCNTYSGGVPVAYDEDGSDFTETDDSGELPF